MKEIHPLIVGSLGTVGIETANQIDFSGVPEGGNSISLILQIIVAVATLFKMFKKKPASVI